jgi:hypothetical protein
MAGNRKKLGPARKKEDHVESANLYQVGMRFPRISCLATACAWLTCTMSAVGQHEQHEHPAGEPEKLGKVNFPVSCDAAVQLQFNRAVAMLHSFWYEKANEEFAAVAKKDPACGMAYWGIAMALYHPIWEAPGPAALKQGSEAVAKARLAAPKTQRERDYIAAIETFYKDFDNLDHHTRALAYEKAMEQLQARYPDDREAAIFYALALQGSASPTDKTYANQRKAGALLEKILADQPDHPGVAHYIIHAYDYPPLAPRPSMRHAATPRSRPIRPMRCICRRIFLRVWAFGRNRSDPTLLPKRRPRNIMHLGTSCMRKTTWSMPIFRELRITPRKK